MTRWVTLEQRSKRAKSIQTPLEGVRAAATKVPRCSCCWIIGITSCVKLEINLIYWCREKLRSSSRAFGLVLLGYIRHIRDIMKHCLVWKYVKSDVFEPSLALVNQYWHISNKPFLPRMWRWEQKQRTKQRKEEKWKQEWSWMSQIKHVDCYLSYTPRLLTVTR